MLRSKSNALVAVVNALIGTHGIKADIDCIRSSNLQNTTACLPERKEEALFYLSATTDWEVRKFRNNLPIIGGAYGLLMGSSLPTSLSAY